MATSLPTLDTLDIVSNESFAKNGYPHKEWELLRREAPVFWYERGVKMPFWAITKHEDIVKISRQSQDNLNGPRLAVFPEFSPPQEDEREVRHLLVMDAPDHPAYRKLTSAYFTPRSVRRLEASIEQIATETLDTIANGGKETETDFVTAVSAPIPLAVLADTWHRRALLPRCKSGPPRAPCLVSPACGADDPRRTRGPCRAPAVEFPGRRKTHANPPPDHPELRSFR